MNADDSHNYDDDDDDDDDDDAVLSLHQLLIRDKRIRSH